MSTSRSCHGPNRRALYNPASNYCGGHCIRRVLTDLAYVEIDDGAFVLKERAPGVSVDEIRALTAGKLVVRDPVIEMSF